MLALGNVTWNYNVVDLDTEWKVILYIEPNLGRSEMKKVLGLWEERG